MATKLDCYDYGMSDRYEEPEDIILAPDRTKVFDYCISTVSNVEYDRSVDEEHYLDLLLWDAGEEKPRSAVMYSTYDNVSSSARAQLVELTDKETEDLVSWVNSKDLDWFDMYTYVQDYIPTMENYDNAFGGGRIAIERAVTADLAADLGSDSMSLVLDDTFDDWQALVDERENRYGRGVKPVANYYPNAYDENGQIRLSDLGKDILSRFETADVFPDVDHDCVYYPMKDVFDGRDLIGYAEGNISSPLMASDKVYIFDDNSGLCDALMSGDVWPSEVNLNHYVVLGESSGKNLHKCIHEAVYDLTDGKEYGFEGPMAYKLDIGEFKPYTFDMYDAEISGKDVSEIGSHVTEGNKGSELEL